MGVFIARCLPNRACPKCLKPPRKRDVCVFSQFWLPWPFLPSPRARAPHPGPAYAAPQYPKADGAPLIYSHTMDAGPDQSFCWSASV